MTEIDKKIEQLYKDYPEIPYISVKRNKEQWLKEVTVSKAKLVPKRNMERLANGLLAGDIILLWRIQFGTFTSEIVDKNWFPKYFEYTYGIDAATHLEQLVANGYVTIESAMNSLEHTSAAELKHLLKLKQVKGFSKLKKDELQAVVIANYTENELEPFIVIRAYRLTEKGQEALKIGEEVVARHPKKQF